MVATKSEVRALIRASRAARSVSARDEARQALTELLTELCSSLGARAIAAFLPTDTEPPVDGLLSWAMARDITVLVPISQPDGSLAWKELGTDTAVATRNLGVPEPAVTGPSSLLTSEALQTVDVILLPAAAVDSRGTRLGWGRGYYDRALAELPAPNSRTRPHTYAVVFDDEVVDELPNESHDEAVDGVVTPSGIRRF